MKRRLALILLALVVVAGSWAQEPTRARKRIAVLSFDPPMEYRSAQIGNIIGDMLTTALVKMGLEVVERSQLEAVLREQQLARSGIIDPATAVEMGKILGVDYILGGRITEFGIRDESQLGGVIAQFSVGVRVRQSTARVKADVRLIDVRTGRILMAETGEGREAVRLAGGSGFRQPGVGGKPDWSRHAQGGGRHREENRHLLPIRGRGHRGDVFR